MNVVRPANLPSAIKEVMGDLESGYWQPQSIAEWAEVQKTAVFLSAWIQQQEQERNLRKMIGIWVFFLITAQVAGVFCLITLDASNIFTLNTDLVKILIPSVLAEVFGMGFVVVKYLFTASTINPFDTGKRK